MLKYKFYYKHNKIYLLRSSPLTFASSCMKIKHFTHTELFEFFVSMFKLHTRRSCVAPPQGCGQAMKTGRKEFVFVSFFFSFSFVPLLTLIFSFPLLLSLKIFFREEHRILRFYSFIKNHKNKNFYKFFMNRHKFFLCLFINIYWVLRDLIFFIKFF
jgi:hypothetical protein